MGVRREVAKEYYAWVDMRRRCTNPAHHQYRNYGGRGIRVCEQWARSFTAFLRDVGPAPSKHHSLGRTDNDGDYGPGNCKWETHNEQDNNKRTNRRLTYNGKTLTITQWAEELNITRAAIACRLRAGKSIPEALNTYVAPKKRKIFHNGEYKSEAEWSRILGIPGTTIRRRVREGKPIDKYTRKTKEQ